MAIPSYITNVKRRRVRRRWKHWWTHPWDVPDGLFRAGAFKKRLWKHGRVSPHYSRREAASKDGTGVPWWLRRNCQKQGFRLERARHRQGDRPMPMLSWYRSPAHNRAVGGVSNSQHLQANACDPQGNITVATARAIWGDGGIGYQGFIGGAVRHVDCGSRRQWVY
jgi:hypothetical protein